MVFDSFQNIYEDFLVQKCSIEKSAYDCMKYEKINKVEALITLNLQELKLTTSFKLLSKLEAQLHAFERQAVQATLNTNLYRQYLLALQNRGELKDVRGRINRNEIPRDTDRNRIISIIRLLLKDNNNQFYKDTSRINEYFKHFRNWYAHGRYWQIGCKPDPEDLFSLCNSFDSLVFSS